MPPFETIFNHDGGDERWMGLYGLTLNDDDDDGDDDDSNNGRRNPRGVAPIPLTGVKVNVCVEMRNMKSFRRAVCGHARFDFCQSHKKFIHAKLVTTENHRKISTCLL